MNKTNLTGYYDIDFSFDFKEAFPMLGESDEFKKQLKAIGLLLVEARQPAPSVYIYK